MRHSLSIVVKPHTVHCGIRLSGQTSSSPLALDQNIKKHHTQFMLVTVGDEPQVYGVTGNMPSQELMGDLLGLWSTRAALPVKEIARISGWESVPHQEEMKMWLSEHLPTLTPRPDKETYLRLIEPFPLEAPVNANT